VKGSLRVAMAGLLVALRSGRAQDSLTEEPPSQMPMRTMMNSAG
jgi:hypothetical protein